MSAWEPQLGISLQCITPGYLPGDILGLDRSKIQWLELGAPMFTSDMFPCAWAALSTIFASGRIRAASIHSVFGQGQDISSPDKALRDYGTRKVCDAVDYAHKAGASMIVVHASSEPIDPAERSRRIECCKASLHKIAEYASARDKRIVIELLPRTCLGNTGEELMELLDGLDPRIAGVCLDTNHAMDRWRAIPDDTRTLGPRLWSLHISDYDGIDEKHQMPGQGVVMWPEFVKALRDINYSGPFNYETVVPGDSIEDRIHALEANFDWICSFLQ